MRMLQNKGLLQALDKGKIYSVLSKAKRKIKPRCLGFKMLPCKICEIQNCADMLSIEHAWTLAKHVDNTHCYTEYLWQKQAPSHALSMLHNCTTVLAQAETLRFIWITCSAWPALVGNMSSNGGNERRASFKMVEETKSRKYSFTKKMKNNQWHQWTRCFTILVQANKCQVIEYWERNSTGGGQEKTNHS